MYRALTQAAPVTTKHVHVYGATPRHTFREVPVGTPASVVLEDAGVSLDDVAVRQLVVVDGGPGWFERVDPRVAVVTRRTNALLVLDPAEVDTSKTDVLPGPGKAGYPRPDTVFTMTPSPLSSASVRVPLVDNPKFKAVLPARPLVTVGARVRRGELVAAASGDALSVDVHAPIDGVVRGVDDVAIAIDA
jgi:Na+-translocating ferredoxin:NAD+ oxidoreductase RnfC subunit